MKIQYHLSFLLLLTSCAARFVDVIPAMKNARASKLAVRQNPPQSSVPVRRNVADLQNDRVSWSLYIQGLVRLQARSEEDQFSYFRISGIHGRPYRAWGNSPQVQGASDSGYCTHNSILFPTWHRPYCSTFEDALLSEVQEVAKLYTNDSAKYLEAARNLRMPFWDWAADPRIPEVAAQPRIQIDAPNGPQTVPNPLYQYRFHSRLDPTLFPLNSADGWFARFMHTSRGINTQNPEAPNNLNNVNSCIQSNDFGGNTWRLLVRSKAFNTFGSTVTRGISLEGIHNTLHGCVGARYGHMSFLSYAAYDPIFWMHHANVDRLFALWQVINPNSYVEPQEDSLGNFALLPGTVVDANTPLQPFERNSGEGFWTSATSRNIHAFSYTYPELASGLQGDQLRTNVTAAINRLYNPQQSIRRRQLTAAEDMDPDHHPPLKEWSLSMGVSKFDLDGERFKIVIFIGDVPQDPDQWEASDSYVGSFVVFPPPPPSHMKMLPRFMCYSEVNIDKGLAKHGCDSENVVEVINFLKKHMHYRVLKFDGTVVDPEEVTTLSIILQNRIVRLPRHFKLLPIYSPPNRKLHIFKPGDLNDDDEN